MKAYIVILGCPKNLVDSEASLSLLRQAGCTSIDEHLTVSGRFVIYLRVYFWEE